MAIQVTRTYVATIRNQQQVKGDLDSLGFAASKLWNIARWTCNRIWSETGTIPEDGPLKAYLKNHERYADLNSQSSQRVIEELAEAFHGWYAKRRNGDDRANPPKYRKNGDNHPRSTVTFKEDGFKHDSKNNRIRLSKGRNLKEHWSDFILCEIETRPDVAVENVRQIKAVWNGDEWELHIVCKHEIEAESPGDETAGIDLGISNFAAVSYSTGDHELYPGNVLKTDERYFAKEIAKCNSSRSNKALRLRQKRSERRSHYLHAVTKHIVTECVERGIGTIAVGNLGGIRKDDETGEPRNWGDRGNKGLHGWAFDRFTTLLTYKAKAEGIAVVVVSERDTSKTCSCCGQKRDANRVERGLYVCRGCEAVMNADSNGAENIRRRLDQAQKVTPSPRSSGDRCSGRVARPVVNLFRRGEHDPSCGQGTFAQQASICKR
ncbi:putative transposase [Halohasta litchfieldiae]|jgi:putative transposase|uniref:Transposase, IS605 OrfB family n=2 Tax=Haloferacaceae TaxID=1644056 RepID=B9LVR3_HALLT|nr:MULTISPECIES: RNA-guided endonuclease TnpB family protein [Halorubraceae]ACM58776.1 transposase, IS605 OrfB family [Halorubrum lacusprofundi ATCC 49239]ATW88016.1 putative transposase [Halohasta litchfieldiae]SEJ04261.1 putative transposase [Halohasta litchfieldiae]